MLSSELKVVIILTPSPSLPWEGGKQLFMDSRKRRGKEEETQASLVQVLGPTRPALGKSWDSTCGNFNASSPCVARTQ